MDALPFSVTVANDETQLTDYGEDFLKEVDPLAALFTGPLLALALVSGLLRGWLVAALFVALAITIASPMGRRWRARRRALRLRREMSPSVITISSAGVQHRGDGITGTVDWSNVSGVIVGKSTVIIRVGSGAWYAPKDLFTLEQIDSIRRLAATGSDQR